jgi:hypothetical protein
MGLESLAAMKAEYQKRVKEEGEAALKDHFKKFFAETPGLVAVRWRQYTPYFNDGDPCEFSIHGVYGKVGTTKEDSGDYDDGFESDYSLKKTHPAEAKALGELEALLSGMEDVLQAVLGDHSMITITPDNVEIVEYEHD